MTPVSVRTQPPPRVLPTDASTILKCVGKTHVGLYKSETKNARLEKRIENVSIRMEWMVDITVSSVNFLSSNILIVDTKYMSTADGSKYEGKLIIEIVVKDYMKIYVSGPEIAHNGIGDSMCNNCYCWRIPYGKISFVLFE